MIHDSCRSFGYFPMFHGYPVGASPLGSGGMNLKSHMLSSQRSSWQCSCPVTHVNLFISHKRQPSVPAILSGTASGVGTPDALFRQHLIAVFRARPQSIVCTPARSGARVGECGGTLNLWLCRAAFWFFSNLGLFVRPPATTCVTVAPGSETRGLISLPG